MDLISFIKYQDSPGDFSQFIWLLILLEMKCYLTVAREHFIFGQFYHVLIFNTM